MPDSGQIQHQSAFGNVLGKYQLGISDVWISNRIDKMLDTELPLLFEKLKDGGTLGQSVPKSEEEKKEEN